MMDVCVQVWSTPNLSTYEWVTVGKITRAKNLDIDYLSKRAIKFFKNAEELPPTDVLRMHVLIDGRREMSMTIVDFFKNHLKNLN